MPAAGENCALEKFARQIIIIKSVKRISFYFENAAPFLGSLESGCIN
jgi:hypothetical protein